MPPKKKTAAKKKTVANGITPAIRNGLSEAVLGFNPGSFGTQLSQVDTLFKNNRWYLLSNMRQLLSELYVEHGLVKTIIDIPAEDGLRGGVTIKSEQLEPADIQKIEVYLERHSILNSIVCQAIKWERLFGGGAILIMTDQDPSTPLNKEEITEDANLEYRAVDMWELYGDQQTDGDTTKLVVKDLKQSEFYNYYGVRVHHTRVIRMPGLTAPSFIRPRLRGWGFSVLETLVTSINQYLKSNNVTFEVIDEFKLDIFRFKNLTQTLLSEGGTEQVQKRVQLTNQTKNYNHAITMDIEDAYEQKQLTFAGLADMMKEFRIQIASDMRMPMTKLFGLSSSGFNSGEDDIENYNAMVESDVRAKCKYQILTIVELTCQKLFGYIPEDLQIEFEPLRIMSSEQEQNVKNAKMTRVLQAVSAGLCSAKQGMEAINKDDLLPIKVDVTDELLIEPKTPEGNEEQPKKPEPKKE